MRSVDLVISAYKEDLEWLNHIPATFGQVYIYNKGPGMISGVDIPYTEIKLKNIGRCDHTYLYHVIHNYNNLADVTIFATGSTYALTHKRNKFRFTLNKTLETRNTVFYADRLENVKKDLYKFQLNNWEATGIRNKGSENSNILLHANTRPFGKWYDEHFPNIDIHAVTFGGVFSVSKEHIHNRNIDSYTRLINEFPFHPNPEVGHYFERAWLAIFHPIPEECIYYTNNMSFQLSKIVKNTFQNFYLIYTIIFALFVIALFYILKTYGNILKIRNKDLKTVLYILVPLIFLFILYKSLPGVHYNVNKSDLAFYTCFYGSNNNIAFKIPPLPSKKFDCYYFTNNTDMIDKIESSGWIYVYDTGAPVTTDAVASCMMGKELKVLPDKNEILNKYKYTCFFDSKVPKVSEGFIQDMIKKHFIDQNYALLLREHNWVEANIWAEFNESMAQERYRKDSEHYKSYINKKLKSGFSETVSKHATCYLLLRNMEHPQTSALNDSWYENIKECGIQDQISFFFVKQEFDEHIHVFNEKPFVYTDVIGPCGRPRCL